MVLQTSTLVCSIVVPARVADVRQYGSRHGKGHACRNRKSGTIIRTAKNAGRVPDRKRGGKFHFSAVNSSFFSRWPCVPPTPLQLSSVAMTSHTSLDGVPGAWRQTLSTAVSCLEEGRAARGEVLRRVVWRTAMTSHSLDGVPGAAWLVWRGEGVVCLQHTRSVYSSLFQSPLQVVAVRLDKLAVFVVGGETARWS